MVIVLSLVGCRGPDIEECVDSANLRLSVLEESITGYSIYADFSREEMTYTIVTYLDEKAIEKEFGGEVLGDESRVALVTSAIKSLYDSDTETIFSILDTLKNAVEEDFKGTEVKIVTYHLNQNGELIPRT